MMSALYTYPVKGLTGQHWETLPLIAGEGIRGNRAIAIARTPDAFKGNTPKATLKTKFFILARDEALALLKTRHNEAADTLTIQKGTDTLLTASLAT